MSYIDQRYRAERIARAIAEQERASEPKAKQSKPAPVKSCWDDPAFCDRVIAKAERRQEILAKIRSQPVAFVSAREMVQDFIKELLETKGMDRSAAMRHIAKTRPDLLEAMRMEANPHMQTNRWRR